MKFMTTRKFALETIEMGERNWNNFRKGLETQNICFCVKNSKVSFYADEKTIKKKI